MQDAVYPENNRDVILEYDRQAINWMRATISWLRRCPGRKCSLYQWGSRVLFTAACLRYRLGLARKAAAVYHRRRDHPIAGLRCTDALQHRRH